MKKETYEKTLAAHTNKYAKADSLRSPSSEGDYRESSQKLRSAYGAYAKEMREAGTPIPIWL
jgi:hypothetical protein